LYCNKFQNKKPIERENKMKNFTQNTKLGKMFNILAALAIFTVTESAVSQYFFKSYDFPPTGTRTEYGYSIERFFDGTVTPKWSVTGVSNSTPNAGSFDWMYLKLSNTGAVSCATLLGFSLADSCFSHIQQTLLPRRNVLAGFYRAANGREKASWSMLDTTCGHFISRQILDSLRHEYRQVVKDPADVFTMAGGIQTYISSGVYQYHILAAQYSPAGALLWAYNYMPPFAWVDERAYSITFQPTDGSYAITGITNRFTGPAGAYQVFIMKISAAGIPIWYKGFSPVIGASSEGRKIIAMSDGGFVVTGFTTAFDAASDVYTFRVTAAGGVMWGNTYGMPAITEKSYSIVYDATDMSLVYTGYATPSGTEDVILAKITSVGGLPVWFKRYPNTPGADRGYDVKTASTPLGYSATGKLFISGSDDPFFLKTNTFGNVTAVCQDSIPLQPRPGTWNDICSRNIHQLTDITINPQVVSKTTVERALCGTITGIISNNEIPSEFILKQNYPNPFNPSTKIEFSLPNSGNVSIKVFDVTGQEVMTLTNGFRLKGNYSIEFNASELPSGAYFYQLKADGFEATKKMLLVK
jgi:hypothetical protein